MAARAAGDADRPARKYASGNCGTPNPGVSRPVSEEIERLRYPEQQRSRDNLTHIKSATCEASTLFHVAMGLI